MLVTKTCELVEQGEMSRHNSSGRRSVTISSDVFHSPTRRTNRLPENGETRQGKSVFLSRRSTFERKHFERTDGEKVKRIPRPRGFFLYSLSRRLWVTRLPGFWAAAKVRHRRGIASGAVTSLINEAVDCE